MLPYIFGKHPNAQGPKPIHTTPTQDWRESLEHFIFENAILARVPQYLASFVDIVFGQSHFVTTCGQPLQLSGHNLVHEVLYKQTLDLG